MSSLAPIGAVGTPLFPDDLAAPAQSTGVNAAGDFTRMVNEGLAEVNEKLKAGEVSLQRLATGDTQNLHQVMIRLEEAKLSFQLLMQVRSRLLEAYQDVMKMQI